MNYAALLPHTPVHMRGKAASERQGCRCTNPILWSCNVALLSVSQSTQPRNLPEAKMICTSIALLLLFTERRQLTNYSLATSGLPIGYCNPSKSSMHPDFSTYAAPRSTGRSSMTTYTYQGTSFLRGKKPLLLEHGEV